MALSILRRLTKVFPQQINPKMFRREKLFLSGSGSGDGSGSGASGSGSGSVFKNHAIVNIKFYHDVRLPRVFGEHGTGAGNKRLT